MIPPALRAVFFLLIALLPVGLAASGSESDFRKEFKKALAQNATAEMQKLVKTRLPEAVATIVEVCEEIGVQPSEELETLAAALREAWKASHKSEFAERVYRYFSTADAGQKKDRAQLKAIYDKSLAEFEGNLEKKDGQVFDFVYAKLRDHPENLEGTGDLYLASQSAYVVARCLDDALRASGADLNGAWKYYTKALELRDKLDLKDPVYEECLRRKTALAAKGFDKKKGPAPQEPGGAEPGGPPAPSVAQGTPLKVPLTFEVVATPDQFQRPTYCADDVYEVWSSVALTKKDGGKAKFPFYPSSPTIVRMGSNDVRVDVNGDGTGDEKVPITGNITPVKLMIGKAADARPWAFLAITGLEKDFYQGIQVNLAPVDELMNLYTLGAASVVGTVGATQLRLIDETMDGVYGTTPQTYGFVGISKDVFQPDFDTMVVGSSKRARPYSEWADLDGAWYRLALDGPGKELTATPGTPPTGFLKLDFKGAGALPTALIVQGKNELSKCFYDLAEAGAKGVSVPAGSYTLFYGEMRKGKKKQLQKCAILPPKNAPGWTVRSGETTVVELGGPFNFDFHTTRDGDKLTVEGKSVRVIGKAGERYERTWNCVPHPEAGVRKKGLKSKPSKYERFAQVLDADAITKQGWDAPWSPLDLVLDVKGIGGDAEVQLVDKKNDLFGKIESEWR